MSQEEVLNFLELHKNEWFTANQIEKHLKIPKSQLCTNLMRLRKSKYIYYKFSTNLYENPRAYIYSYRDE